MSMMNAAVGDQMKRDPEVTGMLAAYEGEPDDSGKNSW